MTELDAAYEALDECLDGLPKTVEVGDIAQTDKIWICRSIINALTKEARQGQDRRAWSAGRQRGG
jgi:hypothetical protein